MEEENFEPDQLVAFCQRLGLGNDGYLDEKELATVCNCIGLQADFEMLQELFETLDTDNDGRVCLHELTQMLRGMPKIPPSPEKHKPTDGPSSSSNNGSNNKINPLHLHPTDFSSSSSCNTTSMMVNNNGDRASFHSILDPNSSGFTKSGIVLDMWNSWGIRAEDGLTILKELGFPISSRNISLNIGDLTKAMEEECDNAKDALPLIIQTVLLTYKTETQYLRSVCESMEGERDKLRSDILEAHQRSTLLAQEVEEMLEKNSQILLQKMEAKYGEQLHELQGKFGAEKESLQQALLNAESQLKSLEGGDTKLKSHINKLKNENSTLELDLKNLNKEIQNLNKAKSHLEEEIRKYVDLENKFLEIERRNSESSAISEAKLKEAHDELNLLRDQNDELSVQVESMREKVKTLKAFHEKRTSSGSTNKRRKGSNGGGGGSKSLTLDGYGGGGVEVDEGTDNEYPLEKMGKFHLGDVSMFSDEVEELETSLVSCSSQPDSGTFPIGLFRTITLVGSLEGETSTDSPSMPPEKHKHDAKKNLLLQREMESETILVENCLKDELDRSDSQQERLKITSTRNEVGTQTIDENAEISSNPDVEMEDNSSTKENARTADPTLFELQSRISQLEADAAKREKEGQEMRDQCFELESSLELLRQEYDKCEIYWHDKLEEARNMAEIDKNFMDEKFQDLLFKIKEYEETFMSSSAYPIRLPPIEERASLEQQVTELEEECEGLRRELRSVKVEQDSVLSNYQRQWESRAVEECNRLEQQVAVLTTKCQEYESRLSSLADQERSNLEESGLVEMLRDRIHQLEFQIKHQEDTFRAQISQLEIRARKNNREKQNKSPEVNKSSSSPQPPTMTTLHQSHHVWNTSVNNNNNSQEAVDLNGRSLLELLHQKKGVNKVEQRVDPLTSMPVTKPNQETEEQQPTVPVVSVSPFLIWPQRYAHQPNNNNNNMDKSASLPFIPVAGVVGGGEQLNLPFSNNVWNNPGVGQQPPNMYNNQSVFGDPWSYSPNPIIQQMPNGNNNGMFKAWCHVELGWLEALRARLRQREDQVQSLQVALHIKEKETDRAITEMKNFQFKHDSDASNWEKLMHQQTLKHKEQGEKLAQSEKVMNDLWLENKTLRTALNSTEQRVLQLENLLKYHMSLAQQQQHQSHHNHGKPSSSSTTSPRSLPYHYQPNFT